MPEIIIPSLITVSEDEPGYYANIIIGLSHVYENNVTVSYMTSDGTARNGVNYIRQEGELVFKPGEISKTIKLDIIQDTSSKEDVSLSLNFRDPLNSILTGNELTIKIMNVDFANLSWSDEFNGVSLNTAVWNYEKGGGGWGNNELQTYTSSNENVYVESGFLHITAHNPSSSYYTSGRITTQAKKEFTHGKISIRARLPEGKGIWPALWMLGASLPTAGWPACGEIDIMECLGDKPSTVYGTVHWNSTGHKSRSGSTTISDKFSNDFHIFSLIRTPNNLKWIVDGQQFLGLKSSDISGFPINAAHFFIFNIAVGGNWPGKPDETTPFPQDMIIDYIRVYQ